MAGSRSSGEALDLGGGSGREALEKPDRTHSQGPEPVQGAQVIWVTSSRFFFFLLAELAMNRRPESFPFSSERTQHCDERGNPAASPSGCDQSQCTDLHGLGRLRPGERRPGLEDKVLSRRQGTGRRFRTIILWCPSHSWLPTPIILLSFPRSTCWELNPRCRA